jgi:hypothetical protein
VPLDFGTIRKTKVRENRSERDSSVSHFTVAFQPAAESTPRRREPILTYDAQRKVARYAASEVVKNIGICRERRKHPNCA